MSYENILSETESGITTITINRPAKLNSIDTVTIKDLHDAVVAANGSRACRVIIITGSGNTAFAAGADIQEFADFTASQALELAKKGQHLLFDTIANLSTPVIAAVNGFALGGGLELAMACHIRVASENAQMALPEVSLGVIPGYGGTQRLPQLVGKGRAMELILTGKKIGAEQALSYGLVNHVKPQDQLLPFCYELARKMMSNSSAAIGRAIQAINANYSDAGFAEEIARFADCFGSPDFAEGTRAFLEKRKPNFSAVSTTAEEDI